MKQNFVTFMLALLAARNYVITVKPGATLVFTAIKISDYENVNSNYYLLRGLPGMRMQ